jgi:hypothetical protein
MEQLDYNLLFRRFVGLAMDAPVWAPCPCSGPRARMRGDYCRRGRARRRRIDAARFRATAARFFLCGLCGRCRVQVLMGIASHNRNAPGG